MTSILLICQKEFKSYFTGPIAYLLMAFFGLIFGFGFYTATRDVVSRALARSLRDDSTRRR